MLAISRQQELAEYVMLLPSCINNMKTKFVGQNAVLTKASESLSPWAFDLFCIELKKSKDYRVLEDNGIRKLFFLPKPTSQPRILLGRCSCLTRRSFLIQCRHEISTANGKFDLSLFDDRWKRDFDELQTIQTIIHSYLL